MNLIKIDNEEYDPYFILDVIQDDDISHITKIFRQKAKLLHPDKLTSSEKQNQNIVKKRTKHFKILVECYDYIISKKKELLKNKSINENFENEILTFAKNDVDNFNNDFMKTRVDTPNDYGYSVERMSNEKDYEQFEYKPPQLFDTKNFNSNDFNKAFEYQKTQFEDESNNSITGALIHKTTDDFYGYNTADLNGIATVNSYNGILITGDNFGQSGIGYSDGNYSDYKQTFNRAKNPESLNIPNDFKYNSDVKKLSKSESDKELRRLQELRNDHIISGSSKTNFKLQEQELLKKQNNFIKEKEENDKQFISQFKNLFKDQNLIETALNGKLIKDSFDNKQLNLKQFGNKKT